MKYDNTVLPKGLYSYQNNLKKLILKQTNKQKTYL